MIRRVVVRNYRGLQALDVNLQPGMNILVGNNDAGKSTLLEAIGLCLTGRLNGRPALQEFGPFSVNLQATRAFFQPLESGSPRPKPSAPPEVLVELYFDAVGEPLLEGSNNSSHEDAVGIRFRAALDPEFNGEYEAFWATATSNSLAPTEYYELTWRGFSGSSVTQRSIPAVVSLIDPALLRLASGVDYHLQQIIQSNLEPKERVELSRQYRSLRETFTANSAVAKINEKLAERTETLTERALSLGMDISQRFTWESSLAPHLNELPLPLVGRGEQSCVKTLLALSRQAQAAHVVLFEEPENHLSHSSLRSLLSRIEEQCPGKQLIFATHSSFVLNKLGLDSLILIGEHGTAVQIHNLSADTVAYFKKLAGFDTLRMVLAKKVILVEGPSDELIVHRAFRDRFGKAPLEAGTDVIAVGALSFRRFLELAARLGRRVAIVTDNDGKTAEQVEVRYSGILPSPLLSVHTGSDPGLPTLEPQLVRSIGLEVLSEVFGRAFATEDDAAAHLSADKTQSALRLAEAQQTLGLPEYILSAIEI